MFNRENRYMTRGISSELPYELYSLLWVVLDEFITYRKGKNVDYLQVFKVEKSKDYIKIIHSQEVPLYKYEIILRRDGIVLEKNYYKIFVIDDDEYCTMMFAEEY